MNKGESGDVSTLLRWLTGARAFGRIGCRENAVRAAVRLAERAGGGLTPTEVEERFPTGVSSHLDSEAVRERLAEALEGHLPGPWADRAVTVLAPLVTGLAEPEDPTREQVV